VRRQGDDLAGRPADAAVAVPGVHIAKPAGHQVEIEQLWERISCPTLLVYGKESWAANPAGDGRLQHFQNARVVSVEGAGHWVHHDRLEAVLDLLRGFL